MACADAAASGLVWAWIDETSWRPNARWSVSENGSGEADVATPRGAAARTTVSSRWSW
jgi:hypothetical protein